MSNERNLKDFYVVIMRDGVELYVSERDGINIKKNTVRVSGINAISLRDQDTSLIFNNIIMVTRNKSVRDEEEEKEESDVVIKPETLKASVNKAPEKDATEVKSCCDNPDVTIRKRITDKGTTMFFPQCGNCRKRFPLVAKKNVEDPDNVLDYLPTPGDYNL